jgi:SNF2 family DNA or RNA helicase
LEADLRSAVIMAGTTSAERSRIFDQVRKGELDAMVAIPQTVMHGLDLSESNTIIWASPPFSHETYEQANARISGSNQKRKCTIMRIWQTPLTRALYRRLDEKKALQDVILELMEERR